MAMQLRDLVYIHHPQKGECKHGLCEAVHLLLTVDPGAEDGVHDIHELQRRSEFRNSVAAQS